MVATCSEDVTEAALASPCVKEVQKISLTQREIVNASYKVHGVRFPNCCLTCIHASEDEDDHDWLLTCEVLKDPAKLAFATSRELTGICSLFKRAEKWRGR